MSIYAPTMRTDEFIYSIYSDLLISEHEAFFFDSVFGAKAIALALKRAHIHLMRHMRREDTFPFQAEAELEVAGTAPNLYSELPSGYEALIYGYSGQYPLHLISPGDYDRNFSMHQLPSGNLVASRIRDRLYYYTTVLTSGVSKVNIRYWRIPPIIGYVGKMDITAVSTRFKFVPSSTHSPTSSLLGYAANDWAGAMYFSIDDESYGYIVESGTGDATGNAAVSGTTAAGTGKEVALINVPPYHPASIDALIAQTCMFIKGEDLANWRERIAMVGSGKIRRNRVSTPFYSPNIFRRG